MIVHREIKKYFLGTISTHVETPVETHTTRGITV